MKEFVVAGLLISPFVKFGLVAGLLFVPVRLILVHMHFQKWFWHPLLAEVAVYICILATINVLF